MDRLSSPGVRQLSVGEVRVRVRGERGVLGVRGEGRVSQALYPLGGGVGIATPERWQQPSASDIQASKSFSLSQSKRVYTYRLEWICTVCIFSKYCSINEWMCCEGLWQSYECQLSLPGKHAPCARSRASAVKRGACSMSAVSTINMSFSLRRSWSFSPS